jgi:hypothetical protein
VKQFISILLTLLLLISNTGVTYAQHFCGGYEMMAKVTLGHERLSCGMAMVQTDCDQAHENKTHSCCNNQYTQVDLDDTLAQTVFQFQITPTFNSINTAISSAVSEILKHQKEGVYVKYNPPPLIKDLPVFFETFLI